MLADLVVEHIALAVPLQPVVPLQQVVVALVVARIVVVAVGLAPPQSTSRCFVN